MVDEIQRICVVVDEIQRIYVVVDMIPVQKVTTKHRSAQVE
jgi:hypothetical protein